jgi:hypothetical protein
MKQWREAAAEFQKIVNHKGLIWNFPLAALAHLQLARASASFDPAAARMAYRDFIVLWQDADSEVPVFSQARRESARLK